MKFHALVPNKKLNVDDYKDILDFSITDEEIMNIGVTGGYGSGKSSVIESYLEKNKYIKAESMQISLGSFSETEDRKINNVEEKIISQLINQIDKKNIPQSIFHKKDNYSFLKLSFQVLFILLLTFSILYIVTPGFIENLFNVTPIFLSTRWFNWTKWIIAILGITYLLTKILKKQLDSKFVKKVSFYGSEIEMKDTEHSYFDKYTNDIIYLFINSGKSLFIFEDLDRFEKPLIYEELVEVNSLINKRIRKNNEKITFMYLIRDDIFDSKERTKLFDILIPIIPVVVQGNTFDKFKELLNEFELQEEFDNKILKKLLFYIDDMRLLKNVLNEYLVYKKVTGVDKNHSIEKNIIDVGNYEESKTNKEDESKGLEIDNNKLLALMVYKNIFPKDFYYFQYGNSYIDYLINKSLDLINVEKDKLTSKIKEINNLILKTKQDTVKNLTELEALYFPYFKYKNMTIDKKELSTFENNIEVIEAIKNNDYNVHVHDNYNRLTPINIEAAFIEMKKKKEFKKRLDLYNEITEETTESSYKEIQSLIKKRSTYDVIDLLNEQEEEFFRKELKSDNSGIDDKNEKAIKENEFRYLGDSQYFDLLIFLLREELVDLRSLDLVSYFYDTNLTSKDRNFIRKLYDRKPIDYFYSISNPELVLEDIGVRDMRNRGVLNRDIAMFCIKKDNVDDIIDILLTIHDNYSASVIKSIFEEKIDDNTKSNILRLANDNNINLINIIIKSKDILDDEKSGVLILLLEKYETAKIDLDKHGDILWKELVSILENYEITDENIKMLFDIVKRLQTLNVKFKNVSISKSNFQNLRLLFSNNLIKINTTNLINLMDEHLSLYVGKDVYKYPFTAIYSSKDNEIIENILDVNITEFLETLTTIIKNQEEPYFEDDAEILTECLAKAKIEENLLPELFSLSKPSSLIKNIKESDEEEFIIMWSLFEPNTQNLMYLLDSYDFSEGNLSHIEQHSEYIDFSDLSIEEQNKILLFVLENNIFRDNKTKLEKTLSSINHNIEDLKVYKFDELYLNLLTRLNKIQFNEINSAYILKQNYSLRQRYFENMFGEDLSDELLYYIQETNNLSPDLRESYIIRYLDKMELNTLLNIIKYGKLNLDQNLIHVLFKLKKEFPNKKIYKAILEHYKDLDLVTTIKTSKDKLIAQGRDITLKEEFIEIDDEIY